LVWTWKLGSFSCQTFFIVRFSPGDTEKRSLQFCMSRQKISRFNQVFRWHNSAMNRPCDKLILRCINLVMNRPCDESTLRWIGSRWIDPRWIDPRWIDPTINRPAMSQPIMNRTRPHRGTAIAISCTRFGVDLMTHFGSLGHKNKKYEFWEIALQNGREIQDGRQTRMFHNSVNFHLNHLKLWNWKHRWSQIMLI
jgi:hypothetical protein